MHAPDDLGIEGRRAFEIGAKQVDSFADPDDFADAVLRFARAIDLVEELRVEWNSHGRPKLYTVNNGTLIAHPLMKMLQSAESDAARAGRALKLEPNVIKRSGPGRPPGASSAADRKAPPRVKLANA